MALAIHSTQSAAQTAGVKILVFGGAGAGKTTLISTLQPFNPIILSAEAGLLSLSRFNLPFMQITTPAELAEAHRWLMCSAEAQQFGAVSIDSISEIAEVVLAKAKATAKDPRQAYGTLIEECMASLRLFRDLPGRHVYVTAKQELQKAEMGLSKWLPSLPGSKLGGQIPYLFDEVFYLGISPPQPDGSTFRYLQTTATFDRDCKDRSGMLDAYEPPDLSLIINKILGK